MRKYNLLCQKFTRRSRKYIAFKGEIGKIANNEINRDFKTNRQNEKWLTDITEFKIKGRNQKIYLSPIMDLYNREIISYSIGTRPTVELAIKALDKALKTKADLSKLTIHSDQGYHYQHISWVKRLEDRNITQSMSRRGNCIDNSPMENFFGILKQEMYYGEEYKSVKELKESIEEYINWYNNERIKEKLNGMSPVQYRQHAA
jgi:transposase InsO family protein